MERKKRGWQGREQTEAEERFLSALADVRARLTLVGCLASWLDVNGIPNADAVIQSKAS